MNEFKNDELSLDELENVLGGAPEEVAYERAMENPDLFREEALDKLVEKQIKKEEEKAETLDGPRMVR